MYSPVLQIVLHTFQHKYTSEHNKKELSQTLRLPLEEALS